MSFFSKKTRVTLDLLINLHSKQHVLEKQFVLMRKEECVIKLGMKQIWHKNARNLKHSFI